MKSRSLIGAAFAAFVLVAGTIATIGCGSGGGEEVDQTKDDLNGGICPSVCAPGEACCTVADANGFCVTKCIASPVCPAMACKPPPPPSCATMTCGCGEICCEGVPFQQPTCVQGDTCPL